MNEERKIFQNLPGKENPQFAKDGKSIYQAMREQYPNDTVEDFDNILNGICASLILTMKMHVNEDNHRPFTQLVYSILNRNI